MVKSGYEIALERIEKARRDHAPQLDLMGLGLTTVPPEIGSLTTLRRLFLNMNQLTALPPEIGALTALNELFLSGNQLTALPREIGSLAALEHLDAVGNRLTALPQELAQLLDLKWLLLGDNRIATLPPEIGALKSLSNLHVGGNQLTAIPPEIASLSTLQRLTIGENQLATIPQEIGALTALQELHLHNNNLTSIPAELGSLTSLFELALCGNQLTDLPPQLREMRSLRRLYLHDNPALKLPPNVLGPDPRTIHTEVRFPSARSILDYYFARVLGESRPLNELKMIVVGRGGAGKTSLVRALRGLPFRKEESSTRGISIAKWKMEGCEKGEVTAHVWDFAGQVVTHALHQFFFSVRTVYVLVLTGRENSEREDAEYWLRLIKAFGTDETGAGPPVLVALNKWDVAGCRPKLDRGAIREKYPFIRGFIEIDCKPGKGGKRARGIDELLEALRKEVDNLRWVREPFKATWDDVRRALASGKRSRPHMNYSEYRKLCGEHRVSDHGEQDSLAEILHNLGAALNYRNDPRLREATVLKPEWLTDNVYRMMRRAEKNLGTLSQDDVDAALKGVQDKAMRSYLVRLMERFEIAYAARLNPPVWLVPQALPDEQPDAAAEFAGIADATRLKYTYPALPEGLVPKAIVRLHEFIEMADGERLQWASGAILTREGARALMRTEPPNEVMVTVTGPEHARRRLAGLCRSEYRSIHAEIPGLNPEELTKVDGAWVSVAALEEDERKGRQTGIQAGAAGTISVDPAQVNNTFTSPAARDSRRWKPRVFICYARADVRRRKQLESALKVLQNEGILEGQWNDYMITPGDEWDQTIKHELAESDVFLFLASTPALASEYINKQELPEAWAMHEAGKIVMVPVILEECRWTGTPLGKLQALPLGGKPVSKWKEPSTAWKSVSDGLANVFTRLIAEHGRGSD